MSLSERNGWRRNPWPRERAPLNGKPHSRSAMARQRLEFSMSKPLKSPNTAVSQARKRFASYFHFFHDNVGRELAVIVVGYPELTRNLTKLPIERICSGRGIQLFEAGVLK